MKLSRRRKIARAAARYDLKMLHFVERYLQLLTITVAGKESKTSTRISETVVENRHTLQN